MCVTVNMDMRWGCCINWDGSYEGYSRVAFQYYFCDIPDM